MLSASAHNIVRLLRTVVPKPLRPALRRSWHALADACADACHHIANHDQPMIPPPSLRTVGSGNFYWIGAMNVRYIKQFAPLEGKRILEVGCGVGRNALALTSYDIEYHGLDIVKPYIQWCQRNITTSFPGFRFHHADVLNGMYNADGRLLPTEFRFPFDDSSFDLVFLTSVFTHMLEPEVAHYVSEIARVLKSNGQLYTTLFLLNEESNRLISEGRASQILLPFNGERVKVANYAVPEAAVGYSEDCISEIFQSNRLCIDEIRHGVWPGRKHGFDNQDVVVAHKA